MTTSLAFLAVIAFLGYGVQTITGFGAGVVAVALGAQLYEINELLLLLLPLSLVQCGYIAVRSHKSIDWGLLAWWIIPVMGAGTAIGAIVAGEVSGHALRRVLAVLILALSLYELYRLRNGPRLQKELTPPLTVVGLLGAGLMHGIFGTGGPLLVYTVGRRVTDKTVFRSTLLIVWLLLNSSLVAYFFFDGRYHDEHPVEIAILLPGVIAGVFIGDRLHDALDGHRFRQVTFGLLAAAAIALLVR